MAIVLQSQRYTIAALGSTLDSRYPGGGASGFTPEAGFTVSGTFADGGSVTIAKASGLGSGPTIAVFDRFEGTDGNNASSSATVGTWTTVGNPAAPKYSSTAHSGSSSALVANADGTEAQFIKTFTAASEFFVSYWMRISVADSAISAGGLKATWLFDGATGYATDGIYDACWPTWVTPRWMTGGNDVKHDQFTTADSFVPANEWSHFSAWGKSNGESPMDYMTRFANQTNGVELDTTPGWTHNTFFGATSSTGADRMSVPGYIRIGAGTTLHYDDFYLATGANAAARVEIGESATYTSCKELSICPHTAWADTSVTVTAYQGGHSSLSGKHLFITNASNTTSYVGSFS